MKNNLCILTGDGSSIASLEQKTRKLHAIAKLQHELGIEHQEDLAQRLEKSEQDFNSTVTALFNRVYYPTKAGLTAARLQMTFTGNRWNGEEQLEKTLAGTGVNKLIVDVDKEAQALIKKAEDLLWPENQRRVPWRDIKHRALTNARWALFPRMAWTVFAKLPSSAGSGATQMMATSRKAPSRSHAPPSMSKSATTKTTPAQRTWK